MGKDIVRLGDPWIGTCFNHAFPIAVSGNVGNPPQDFSFDESRLIAVDGTVCPASCGHTGLLQASSILTNINGIRIGLIGDLVVGSGINGNVIAGSTLTNSD